MLAAGFLDTHDGAVFVEGEQARADVDGGNFLNLAVITDCKLAGAAADIDVQNDAAHFFRVRHRARAVSGHRCFQTVAGADRDEFAGFLSEQFGDRASVAPAHGDAGENQRAGVDFLAADLGVLVLLVDESFERFDVDSGIVDVGREQNLRFVQDFAFGDAITRTFEGQFQPGKNQVRCRRADVDADAGELKIFFLLHVAVGIGKRTSGCGGHENPLGQ